jgi:hypothetical protein
VKFRFLIVLETNSEYMMKISRQKSVNVGFAGMFLIALGLIVIPWSNLFASPIEENKLCAPKMHGSSRSRSVQENSSDDSVARFKKLTEQLANIEHASSKRADMRDNAESKATIGKLLAERKSVMLKLIEENPEVALKNSFVPEVQDSFATLVPDCVEKTVIREGVLSVIVVHHTNGTHNDIVQLTTDSGERIYVGVAYPNAVEKFSGKRVKVTGAVLDNKILVNGSDENTIKEVKKTSFNFLKSSAEAYIPESQGTQRTAVLMVNFSDTQASSLTKQTVDTVMFNQVNDFYQDNSYDQTDISGQSFGWFTMSIASSTCDLFQIYEAAIAVADPSVDFTQFDRVVLAGKFSLCGYSGVGTIGKTSTVTNEGEVTHSIAWINDGSFNQYTVSHEFGHNLGVHHANDYDCGATLVSPPCTSQEYGGVGVMAGLSATPNHMNAPHKDIIGWFNAQSTQEITQSGRYMIAPIETATSGQQILKIPRSIYNYSNGQVGRGYLWVEYRQPVGYDSNFGTHLTDGAILHITNPNGDVKSYMLDATPTEDNSRILPVGQSVTDTLTGTTLTVVARTAQGITVDVAIGKTDFTPPTVAIVSPTANSVVSGLTQVTVEASDTSGIQRVELHDATKGLIATKTEAPYVFDWDTTHTRNGSNLIKAVAYDLSGEPYGIENNRTDGPYTVFNIQNPDSVSPTVSLTAPTASSTQPSNAVTITAEASDDVGLYQVRFHRDSGTLLATFTYSPGPYTRTLSIPAGNHTVYAIAEDYAGNKSTSTVIAFTSVNVLDIAVSQPVNGAMVTGIVPVSATTTGALPISRVEFYADNVLFGTDSISPYTANWDSVPYPLQTSHALQVKAFNSSNVVIATSTINTVTLHDPTPPFVALLTSGMGIARSTTYVITATSTDAYGVAKVEFYANGVKTCTDTTSPYTCSWLSPSKRNITTQFRAVSYDNSNNIATSSAISLITK